MKPQPEIFELVFNKFVGIQNDHKAALNARMIQYCHVGDSESRDYWGALRAGCGRAFLLKPNGTKSDFWAYDDSASTKTNIIPNQDRISCLTQILERI